MTLAQLRYAVAVDTHRHFGRAAAACFVSQPTLSASLKKLEDELGAVLFDRSRQPVVPTAAGERVVTRARGVLREADALARDAGDRLTEPEGTLRVGVIPTLASCLLPLVAGPFATRFPRARLTLIELTTDAILDHLVTERIDAALVATDENQPGLRSALLFSEPFVAYVGSGHPLAAHDEIDPARLSPTDVWLLSEGHCFRDQVLHLCGTTPDEGGRAVRFESGSLETLRRMADRTGGVTLLTELSTLYLTGDEATRVRPLTAPVPRREVRLLTVRAHLKEGLIDAFAATVREAVAEALT